MLSYIKKYPISYLLVAVIWVVCMIPVPETPLDEISFVDKWTHFVMYGALTIVIWWEYQRRHDRICWRRLIVGGVFAPVVMGGLVELAQAYLTTCRSGDIFDAVCNSLGVLLGAGFALLRVKKLRFAHSEK